MNGNMNLAIPFCVFKYNNNFVILGSGNYTVVKQDQSNTKSYSSILLRGGSKFFCDPNPTSPQVLSGMKITRLI